MKLLSISLLISLLFSSPSFGKTGLWKKCLSSGGSTVIEINQPGKVTAITVNGVKTGVKMHIALALYGLAKGKGTKEKLMFLLPASYKYGSTGVVLGLDGSQSWGGAAEWLDGGATLRITGVGEFNCSP